MHLFIYLKRIMKNIFTLLALCMAIFSNAQQITVTDQNTREGISNAVITGKGTSASVMTDGKGKADISALASADTIYVRHTAYGVNAIAMSDVKATNVIKIGIRYMQLNEVVFAVTRGADLKVKSPYQVETISSRQVEATNPQTSADMLINSGMVFAQKSQMGGGSPVLRGFEASRVLIVVDGVRMNNAIYRAGHLQDVITVDPNMLERTEIVFGPSSVAYGSDALGGTMHFFTRKPMLATSGDKTDISGNFMTRFSNANNEKTGHLDLNIGLQKVAFMTSFTYGDFGDLRAGNLRNPYDTAFGKRYYYAERINGKDSMMVNKDPNVQVGTAYKQYDFMEKILIKTNDNTSHLINFQLSTSSDIPRYDRLTEFSGGNLKFAEWNYGPQKRMLASYRLGLYNNNALYNSGSVTAAFQSVEQERINRRFNNKFRTDQLEKVNVISLNADFDKRAGEKHILRYGLDFQYNMVNSTATKTDIVADTSTAAATRYPDGDNTMMFTALYAMHTFNINDKLTLTDGIRVNMVSLESNWVDTTFFPFPYKSVKQSAFAPSGSLGLTYRPNNKWRFHVLGSTGFRAPNVDDMTKVFDSSPGYLVVPNPELKPEYAYNFEVGISKSLSEVARVDVVYFNTLLSNAIVVKEFTLDGKDTVDFQGTPSQVVAAQNVDHANIQGVSATFTADFNANFSFRSTFNYTKGTYTDTEGNLSATGNDTIVPLDHIAPIFGRTGLVYKNNALEMEAYTLYNGAKRLKDYSPSGEDNLQYATAVGMPAWYTLNLRAGYQFGKYVHLNVALENIMDQHYRYFASGVSAAGRNLVTSLRVKF